MSTATILKNFSRVVCGAAAVALGKPYQTGSVQATTLTFDDLPATKYYGKIADGYGGLNWDNFFYFNAPVLGRETGYDQGRVSGQYVAYNSLGEPAAISRKNSFDFNSAYLTSAWNNGNKITVEGLYNGECKYSQTIIVNTQRATKFYFNFLGINELKFSSSAMQFVMDNFTFTFN